MGTPFSPPTTRDREVFITTELRGLLPPGAFPSFTLIPRPPKEDAPLSDRTTSYLTLAVPDPKHLNAVLSYLAHALPLPARHSHLRRVRQQPSPPRVLLCPETEGWRAAGLKEAPAQLIPSGLPTRPLALLLECAVEGSPLARLRVLLATPTLTLECHPVVTTPPRGREECSQESGSLWPMCYRLPQGSAAEEAQEAAGMLGVEEVAYFSRGMALALQQAAQGEALGYEPQGAALCLPSPFSSSSYSSQQRDGAASGSAGGGGGGRDGIDMVVRGVGFSKTHLLATADTGTGAGTGGAATTVSCPPQDHPFASSVMEAIECVAKGDRERESGVGGGGKGGEENAQGLLQPRRMDLPEDRLAPSLSEGGGAAGFVGGGVEGEGAPIVARKKRPRSGGGGGGNGGGGVGTEGDSEEEEKEGSNNCPSSPPTPLYICTGCDAFLTHEPSIGDAMALVHARVGRVVFLVGAKEGEGGLLGWGVNKVRLHGVKALNHHFNAYVAAAGASAL